MLRWTLLRLVTYPVLTFTVGWLRWPPLRVRCWQPPPHPHRGHYRQRRWMWSQDEARHVCSFYWSSSSTWLKLKVSLRSYSKIRVVARRGIGGFSRSCLGFDSRSSHFPVRGLSSCNLHSVDSDSSSNWTITKHSFQMGQRPKPGLTVNSQAVMNKLCSIWAL